MIPFVKQLLAPAALAIAISDATTAQQATAAEPPPRPNIVLFLVDDMGWQDTSVPFADRTTAWNRLYRTPHMEDLARRGAKFTQAYSAHPVCSPSRVSMMTGKNPARTHVDDWVGHGQSHNRYLRSPQWASNGLQPDDAHTTLPEVLASAGYRTIHVGKAHFGHGGTAGADPRNLGFQRNIAGSHAGSPWGGWISPWLGKHKHVYPNLDDRPAGEYLTRAITVKATETIDGAIRDGKPFFLNLAHFAVHTRIAPAPDHIAHYRDGRPEVEANYASMIEAMDASLGSVLAKLRDPNGDGDPADSIAEQTLVVFLSDNGGLSNHTRSKAGPMRIRTSSGDVVDADFARDEHNRPLRSGKGSAYEGGFRIPMIVAWAGQAAGAQPLHASLPIRPGATVTEPVHMDDVFPTVLDVAGVANPVPAQERDGQSITALLAGAAFDRRAPLFWHYPHQWYRDLGVGPGIEPFSAMRVGRHKVVYFYGDGVRDGEGADPRVELYDLVADPGEARDLATTKRELCIELRDRLVAWLRQVGAGIPIVAATGEPAELPKPGSPLE